MDKDILLYIEWKDHSSEDKGWQNMATLDAEAPIIRSIGFFIKETEDSIVLAGAMGSDEEFGTMQYILKNCIVNKAELTKRRRKVKKT